MRGAGRGGGDIEQGLGVVSLIVVGFPVPIGFIRVRLRIADKDGFQQGVLFQGWRQGWEWSGRGGWHRDVEVIYIHITWIVRNAIRLEIYMSAVYIAPRSPHRGISNISIGRRAALLLVTHASSTSI